MGATGMWLRKPDTASTGDPLVLVVVEGSDRRTLVLDHFPFTVGRRTDRDLVMADPRVSREHAHFIREADGTYLIDQGSRHGTFVNGERVNRRKLGRNDHVEFGVQGAAYTVFSPDRVAVQRGATVPKPVFHLETGDRRRIRPRDAQRFPRGGAQA